MEYKLPPLPELSYLGDDASYGYEAIDMTEYAEQAVAPLLAEIERLEEIETAYWKMLEDAGID